MDIEFINKDIQFIHPTMKRKDGSDYYRNLPFGMGNIGSDEPVAVAIERVLNRVIKNKSLTFSDLPKNKLRELLRIVEFDKPKSFPKFNNEKKFTAFNGKYINPEILSIRWNGQDQIWEYRLKNIGHIFDYQDEKFLRETI